MAIKVAIIDAEIVGKTKHRFPNLCCMKISSYHKSLGDSVELKTDYDNLESYDRVYISKVFVKTRIPNEPDNQDDKNEHNVVDWYADNELLKGDNVYYGGTGFFYDRAPPLAPEIEHCMPDYHLYDEWVKQNIANGVKKSEFAYYQDYSIGFLTRKCFRGCYYCVNRNFKMVERASALSEFYDPSRPKLCFLDDNFLGCAGWEELIRPVIETGKPFQFKQGLDERLLTQGKIQKIAEWKYDGDMIFAFDNIEDKDIIEDKLKLIVSTPQWNKRLKFYVFCGCDKTGRYDEEFWERDITNLFERIRILNTYGALPYIMRFEKVYHTEYAPFYAAVAGWCNQPSIFRTFPFETFCQCKGMRQRGYETYKRDIDAYLKAIGVKGSTWLAMEFVGEKFPEIRREYFQMCGATPNNTDKGGDANVAENVHSLPRSHRVQSA